MLKIKTNLFETVLVCSLLPNLILVFNTFLLTISIFVPQEDIVYKAIILSYICCIGLFLILLLMYLLITKYGKKQIIFFEQDFEYENKKYKLEEIYSCEYYVCKWYAIPFVFLYKQQMAGLLEIRLKSCKKIQFRIFYKDYLKLKKYLHNIVER